MANHYPEPSDKESYIVSTLYDLEYGSAVPYTWHDL